MITAAQSATANSEPASGQIPALARSDINSRGGHETATSNSVCRGAALPQSPPRSSWSLTTINSLACCSKAKHFDATLQATLSRFASRHPDKPYRMPSLRLIGRAVLAEGVKVPVIGRIE